MASTPTPRSLSTILSDMVDNVLSKVGLRRVKIGGPLLSVMEAAAQSDFRATQDFYNLLDSQSIDRATGSALKSLAADENLTPITARPSSGYVTFSDTSFAKTSSVVYQGLSSPNAGSTTVYVTDATSFPASGQVYIGRDTSNYEGPITYNAKTSIGGNYWSITIPAGTTKFHNIGETIIVAQGSTRVISAGTTVRTPQGNATNAISFTTLYPTQIEDGETEVAGIEVISSTPGVIGNIPAYAIKEVSGNPYIGASATNPLPFTNGTAAEDDASLRERIKAARQSRQKGISLAITSGIQGVVSKEDNKSVISSSLITRQDETTLYIDDGIGYEETTDGIPQEILMDSALGGEQFFQLAGQRPIAKAFITAEKSAPYVLSEDQILAVKVGGVQSEHTFTSTDFVSIGNATAYEVVSSINSNPGLLFSARTTASGTGVSLFAKAETVEDIEISAPSVGADANVYLDFPSGIVYTLRLFKNDSLLYKDGKRAIVSSVPQSFWSNSITNGDTLIVQVDGTAQQTFTFNDSDFVTANTGYSLVSASNSLASWVAVFNAKIPGITAEANSGSLTLTSNVGFSSRANITIVGGTLTAKTMFTIGDSASGTNKDYTLDRNTGQLKLESVLVAGDSLVVATDYTRAYIQSQAIPSASVTLASAAKLWFVVDSNALIPSTGVNTSTTLTVSDRGNNRARYAAANGTFGTGSTGYIAKGDWFVLWDPNFADLGFWRISTVDTATWAYFEVERSSITLEAKVPASGGFAFVRTTSQIQEVSITSGGYPASFSLTALASTLSSSLLNATASVFRGTKLRVATDSYGNGDILLVTANTQGQLLKLPIGQLATNSPSHFAVVESGNTEYGTPGSWTTIGSAPSSTTFTTETSWYTPTTLPLRSGDFVAFRKRLNDDTWNKYGANAYDHVIVEGISGTTITARSNSKTNERLVFDRFYAAAPYATTAYDQLNVVLDKDSVNKNYNINLFRNVKPKAGETYGAAAFELTDTDNSNASLYGAFGTTTSLFNDFAFYMKARGKSHSTTAHKSILWRFARYGSEGNYGRVAFTNPTAGGQSLALTTNTSDGNANISIRLPSSAAKTGLGLSAENYFTAFYRQGGTWRLTGAAGVVTATLAGVDGYPYGHGLEVGDQVFCAGAGGFLKGPKVITGITTNTFTYAEAGAPVGPTNATFLQRNLPAGTTYTVTALSSSGADITATFAGAHIFAAGDTVYFEPSHWEAGPIYIAYGAKTITSIGANTVTWAEATGAGACTLIPGISYTISSDYCVKVAIRYYQSQVQIGNMDRDANGVVTVLFDDLPGDAPYQIGDIVYLSPGEANFAAGPKIVSGIPGSNAISYVESGAVVASTMLQYFTSTASNPNLTGGDVVAVGDVVHLAGLDGVNTTALNGEHRVKTVTGTGFDFLLNIPGSGASAEIFKVGSLSNMTFYPINTAASTAALIRTWVNANASNVVSATLIKDNANTAGADDGASAIDKATIEEYYLTTTNASLSGSSSRCVSSFPLSDGLNFVKTTNIGVANSHLALKDDINGELVAFSDFDNEEIRLSPITAVNFGDYLSSAAVSGLGQNATISSSQDNSKLQIESDTIGSQGAVQVAGGTGNQASASVYGAGSEGTGYCLATIPIGQINGLTGGIWIEALASAMTNKALGIGAASTVAVAAGSSASEWEITCSDNLIGITQQSSISGKKFQIEKQGDYTAFVGTGAAPLGISANIKAGDWVYVVSSVFNPANVGLKRIVSVDSTNKTFLVDDQNGVEEVAVGGANDYLYFVTYDSTVPGDSLSIGDSILGSSNIGTFPISRFSISAGTLSAKIVYVTGSMTPIAATALGTSYVQVNVKEGQPLKLIKRILTIHPNATDSNYYDVTMSPSSYGSKMLASTGTTLTALDKLAFPNTIAIGIDGYKYNTGLIAEVNKVVYGDEFNPSVYPGIIATGANINISGPLVKRITVSLSVRLRTGVSSQEMQSRIKSAVAATINNSKVGESIAISDVVSAANSLDGVLAVSMLSPSYTSINDLIQVQSHEKALVLDLNSDIQVSIVA
jgi:hypothetical protein